MKSLPVVHSSILVALLALFQLDCADPIEIPNLAPTATIQDLVPQNGILAIYYELRDADADDLSIEITICDQSDCFTPTPAPGGDGTANLPTLRNQPVLRLYRWNPTCDLTAGQFNQPLTVSIIPHDQEQTGLPAVSDPFSLFELGVTAGTCP